jgi:SOS response regulatory protein OraA/RecX
VPTITALRERRRGRIAVELDGSPWRELPASVVAGAGLAQGLALDRPALRRLRRELRREEALALATRALRNRDLSTRRLAERLEGAAVAPAAVEASVATLARAGLVDNGRFAANRAAGLAERGYGDAAIRHDLRRQGVDPELVQTTVEALEPESTRAQRLVVRRGPGPRTARFLASKGFGEDALEAALGADFANDP